jgi:hypothetical protein
MRARCKLGYREGALAGPVYVKDNWYDYYNEVISNQKIYWIVNAYVEVKQNKILTEDEFNFYFDDTKEIRNEKINQLLNESED